MLRSQSFSIFHLCPGFEEVQLVFYSSAQCFSAPCHGPYWFSNQRKYWNRGSCQRKWHHFQTEYSCLWWKWVLAIILPFPALRNPPHWARHRFLYHCSLLATWEMDLYFCIFSYSSWSSYREICSCSCLCWTSCNALGSDSFFTDLHLRGYGWLTPQSAQLFFQWFSHLSYRPEKCSFEEDIPWLSLEQSCRKG